MSDSPPTSTGIGFDSRSPTINISEGNREGVINVLFKRDPKIVDWICNTWFDSHIEVSGDEKDQTIEVVPNSTYYICEVCHLQKSRDGSVMRENYLVCSGTSKEPHKATYTTPIDWRPYLKRAGLYYLLGQANGTLNTNIATGNLSGSEADMKKNMTLEERLRYKAWFIAYSTVCVIASQYKEYVAEWVLKEKRLHQVFSVSFCTNFIVDLADNILANSSKGKGMGAASKVMETHVSSEAKTHHEIDYQYPQGAAMQQRKGIGERISDIMNFK